MPEAIAEALEEADTEAKHLEEIESEKRQRTYTYLYGDYSRQTISLDKTSVSPESKYNSRFDVVKDKNLLAYL